MFKRKDTFYVTFRSVPDGKWKQRVGGKDRRIAKALENRLRLEWEQFRATGMYRPPVRDLTVETHIKDYANSLQTSAERTGLVKMRLHKATWFMSGRGDTRKMSDLREDRLEAFLKWAQAEPFAARTVDEYGCLLKAFGAWMVGEGRLDRNPFRSFKRTFRPGQETFVRRTLTLDEVRRLAEAAPERACLYYLAATTGLRAGELKALTWEHLKDTESMVSISLPGHFTKSGKPADVPVPDWVYGLFASQQFRRQRQMLSGVREIFDPREIDARVIRQDAKDAEVEIRDDQGRRLDFHSLRNSTVTILMDLGVRSEMIQLAMRHSSYETTMSHYHKTDLEALAAEIKIPDPRSA